MNTQQNDGPTGNGRYEIRIRGRLDQRWSDWFEGFTLTIDSDETTTLTGTVIDQAALHGLLRRVGDLGVTLISVNVREADDLKGPAPAPTSTS
jgi:hypothetical protein